MDLTEEQIELIYQQFLLDNPPANTPAYTDDEYDKEERLAEGYNAEEAKEEGRLPIADHESFNDPEFDAEWDAEDEDEDSNFVEENGQGDEFDTFEEVGSDSPKSHIDDEWEEV